MNKHLLAVLISNYGAVISIGFFTPIFALYVVKLGGTIGDVGIATAIYYIAGGALMLLFRSFMNRRSSLANWYILGNLLEAITALLFIFVQSVLQFYIVQILHAVATALRVPSQRALFARLQDHGKEGSEWSVMEGGDFIILGLSAALGGAVVYYLNFSIVFLIMAFVQTIAAVYALRLRSHQVSSS
jgi:Na+/melibiose symporter-like transporter